MIIGLNLFTKRKIFLVFAAALLIFACLEIWVSNRLSTFGEQLVNMETSKNSLILENELLQNQIDQKESLMMTSRYANYLGFQENKSVQYLQDPNLALSR